MTSNPVPNAMLRARQELDYNHLHAFSFQMSEYQADTAGKKKIDSQALPDNGTRGVSAREITGSGKCPFKSCRNQWHDEDKRPLTE